MVVTTTTLTRRIPELLPMLGRSTSGYHVSELIHSLAVRTGRRSESQLHRPYNKMQMGCALEHGLIARYQAHYPGRYFSPGEVEKDGIFGTPDLFDGLLVGPDEIKWSYYSITDPTDDKYFEYFMQGDCYAWMMECDNSRLHIASNHLDSATGDSEYVCWQREYTWVELSKVWASLLAERERIRQGR